MTKLLKIAPVALCMSLCLGGCNILGAIGYLFAPDTSEKDVEANYKDLPGHSVAVVVFADQNTLFEYPYLRYDIGEALSAELGDKVDKLKPVSAAKVVKYQDQNLDWDSKDRTEMGKALGADYVLYIALEEFSTKEVASAYLYRGRVLAEVSLYKCSLPEREAVVWKCPSLKVAYPDKEEKAKANADERAVHNETIHRLATRVTENFYKHKEKAE